MYRKNNVMSTRQNLDKIKQQNELMLSRLLEIKSSVDTNQPKIFPHLDKNLKRKQIQEDKFTEIERENRILLEKIQKIVKIPPDQTQTELNEYKFQDSPPTNYIQKLNKESQNSSQILISTYRSYSGSVINLSRNNQISKYDIQRKKRLQQKIELENLKMLERLNQKQSSINFKEMNEQEQNRQRILQDISLMPLRRVQKDHNYVFTRNLNQLDKLQNSTGDIINSNRSPRSKSVLDMMQTKFNTQFIQRTVRAHQSSLDMMDMKYQSLFIDRPEPLPQERAILYKKGKFIDDQYHIIEISKSLNDGLYITAYPMNQPNNYKVLKIQSMDKNESIISGSSNQNRDTKIFEFMKQFNHDYDKLAESLKIFGDRLKIVKVSNYDLTKQDFYDSLQTKINRITKSKPRDNSKMRMTLDQINNKQKSQEQSNIEAKNLSMFSQLYQTSKSSGIKVVKKSNQNLNSTLINSDYQIQDLNSTLYASTRNQYSTFDKIKSQRPSDMSRIKITNSASIVQTNKTNQELLPKIKTKLQLQNQSKNNELNITVKHDQTFGKQKLSQNDIKISNEMSIQDQMDLHSKVNTLAQQTQLHIDYIEEQQIQSISPPTKHISFKETQLSVAQQEKRLNSQQEKANSILQDQKSIKAGVEQNIIQWQDPIQISSADTQSLQNPQISYVYSENSNSMNVKTNRLNKAITIQDVSNNHLNNGQSVQKQNQNPKTPQ